MCLLKRIGIFTVMCIPSSSKHTTLRIDVQQRGNIFIAFVQAP
jgi:hypothetical protein